jgi:competence protein ComEA
MSPRNANSDSEARRPAPLLRRMDQAVFAALTLSVLVFVGMYWLAQGGASGRLIEIDRAPRQTVQFQLDINEADWPEFSVLPGIGEALARRIVESRAARGPFADLDELRRVRGIGPKTLERIRPYLRPLPGAGNVAGP